MLCPLLEANTTGTLFSIALHLKTAIILSEAVVRPNQAKLLKFTTKFEPFLTIPLTTSGAKISKQIGAENCVSSERENTLYSLPGLNSDILEMFFLSHDEMSGNHDENGIISPKGIR